MWRRNHDRHCSDEELLGQLDGELSRRQTAEVESHLQRCWECRARSARLNEQSQELARLFAAPSYLSTGRMARGKALLHMRESALERQRACGDGSGVAHFQLTWTAACVAVVAAALAGFWLWQPSAPAPATPVNARAALQRARAAEETAGAKRAVHQVYSVEILQERPIQTRQVRRLEVWDDPAGGRYSSTLRDAAGELQFAVWAPGGTVGYEVERAALPVAAPVRRVETEERGAAAWMAADGGDVASAFKAWLKERHWQRLTPAADFAAFASEDAVVLGAERAENGTLRLTARRLAGDLKLTAVLELDGAGRARVHAIRVEKAGSVRELRLREEQFEALESAGLDARVFQPSVPVAPGAAPAPEEAASAGVATNDPGAEREVEVYYALHRAGACLKETVEVNREAGGRIGVRLLVADAARAAELRAVLGRLASAPYVDIEIETGRSRAHARAAGGAQTPLAAVAERWNGVWEEGVALVELANHLGGDVQTGLAPESRLLLQTMVRDHATAVSAKIAGVRAVLAPVPRPGEAPALPLSEDPGRAGADWRQACFRLFQVVDRADRLIEADAVQREEIPTQELPQLYGSLDTMDWLAGAVLRNANKPRLDVASSSSVSTRGPRLGKGAPK